MKALVIGAGSIGKRHAKNLADLNVDVTIVDVENDYRNILDSDKFMLALVCTPPYLHADQCVELLNRGINVFCEKPLVTTRADVDKIKTALNSSSALTMVGCNLRFHDSIIELKNRSVDLIKEIHSVFSYDLRKWRQNVDYKKSYSANARLGGGVVFDCIHEWDYLCWIFGEIDKITIDSFNTGAVTIDATDKASSLIQFKNGKLATINVDYLGAEYTRYYNIVDGCEHLSRVDIIPNERMYIDEMKYIIGKIISNECCMNNFAEASLLLEKIIDALDEKKNVCNS